MSEEVLTEEVVTEDVLTDEPVVEEQTDGVEIEGAEGEIQPPKATKRISDRVNQIKAKAEAKYNALAEEKKSLEERLMKYEADELGITVDELVAQNKKREDEIKAAVRSDPDYQRLERAEFERQKADVLSELQTEFPKDNITDIDSFPPLFYTLLANGVDPKKAYKVSVADEKKTAPPTTGSMKSEAINTSGIYTEEQVRAMSKDEISKNYDAVIRSMKTWKKKE